MKLAYQTKGHGTPVVLLHGFPLTGSMWQPQIEALSKTHRVIIPDLRGFGQSAQSPTPWTIEDLAHDVAELMDTLTIGPAVVVGFSMGGYVALALAETMPDVFRSLVLMSTHPYADSDAAREDRKRMSAIVQAKGTSAIVHGMLEKLLTPDTLETSPHLVRSVKDMILKTPVQTVVYALDAMANRPDRTHVLAAFQKPTLIVVGREDQIITPQMAKAMKQPVSHASLEIIENGAHLLNLECADQTNTALIRFLQGS